MPGDVMITPGRPTPFSKDSAYWLMVLIPAGFIAGLYLTPVISVMIRSVTEPVLGFGNYVVILDNKAIQTVLGRTAYIVLVTTSLTLFFGYITAYAIVHARQREQRIIFFLVILTFWISVLIRTFAWIAVLQPRGLVNEILLGLGIIDSPLRLVRNDFGVIVGMVHICCPMPFCRSTQTCRQLTDLSFLQQEHWAQTASLHFSLFSYHFHCPGWQVQRF